MLSLSKYNKFKQDENKPKGDQDVKISTAIKEYNDEPRVISSDGKLYSQPRNPSPDIQIDEGYDIDKEYNPFYINHSKKRLLARHTKDDNNTEQDIYQKTTTEYPKKDSSQTIIIDDASQDTHSHCIVLENTRSRHQQNDEPSKETCKITSKTSTEYPNDTTDQVSLVIPKRTASCTGVSSRYFNESPRIESSHKRKMTMISKSEDEDEDENEDEDERELSTTETDESNNENTRPELHMPKPSKLHRNRSHGSFSSVMKHSIQKRALNTSPITQPKVSQCPYCHEPFELPLPEPVADALKRIELNTRSLKSSKDGKMSDKSAMQWTMPQKRRKTPIREQYAFCRLHEIELVIKPQGRKENYPENIDFENLENRILNFKDELDDVVFGIVQSSYRSAALKAYEDLGTNKARSTMGVMARFEATLPGYYGSRGSAIMLEVLSRIYLHTGHLTAELTAPQAPLEYLQQVLIPEIGFRLIREDLWIDWQNQKKLFGKTASKPKRNLSDVAKQRMEESSNYGSMIHPFIETNTGMSSDSDVEFISSNSIILLSESDD
ncbi:hypothetical protein CLU79DRAFT_754778 [Phycomyces nitens]|nr:hypothetical protein CLU79DRAFT_754778 [Phycomyces nitens]